MKRRTTIEIDDDLLARARRALENLLGRKVDVVELRGPFSPRASAVAFVQGDNTVPPVDLRWEPVYHDPRAEGGSSPLFADSP